MFSMGMTRNRQADRDKKGREAAVRRAVVRQQVRQIIKKEEADGTSEEEIPEEIKPDIEEPLVTLEGEKEKKKKKKEVSVAGIEEGEKKKKKKKKKPVSEDQQAEEDLSGEVKDLKIDE